MPLKHRPTSKIRAAFGVTAAALVLGVTGVRAQDAAEGWYTEEQAASGELAYLQNCEACHGDNLNGGVGGGPPLAGEVFFEHWTGVPLDGLFVYVKELMPQDNPNSLSNQTVSNILAFILQYNGFPAGSTALSRNPNDLMEMIIERP